MSNTKPYGSRSQVGALVQLVEGRPAAKKNTFVNTLAAFFRVGGSSSDERQRLAREVAPDKLGVQSAVASRTGVHLTSGRVRAEGSVAGVDIPANDVFVQWAQAVGTPKRAVVVLVPGYGETGRHLGGLTEALVKGGYDVLRMDQTWAGHTTDADGKQHKGRVTRGYEITRDVAAVTAEACVQARSLYGEAAEVIVCGNSMGALFGAAGTTVLADDGGIVLKGPPVPKGLLGVLTSPLAGVADTWDMRVASTLAAIPGVRRIPLLPFGIPRFAVSDPAQRALAQKTTEEAVRVRADAVPNVLEDLRAVRQTVASRSSDTLKGRFKVLHSQGDRIASYTEAQALARDLGTEVITIPGEDHLFSEIPSEQAKIVQAVDELLQGRRSAAPGARRAVRAVDSFK